MFGLVHSGALDELPCLRQWLDNGVPAEAAVGALLLDLSKPLDCRVLWTVARRVAGDFQDFFVADAKASEVYLLHHHDKVVVSIPDQHTRWLLLEELADSSTLFEDYSGYDSPMDQEDEVVPEE